MGGRTPAPRTARLPCSTRHSPHTPRASTCTRPVPDTRGRPVCMSHTAGVAMRECKRPGMTSSPHSPRVYRLSRPGAVSGRSFGAASVTPGGNIIICPLPTGVLRSDREAWFSGLKWRDTWVPSLRSTKLPRAFRLRADAKSSSRLYRKRVAQGVGYSTAVSFSAAEPTRADWL